MNGSVPNQREQAQTRIQSPTKHFSLLVKPVGSRCNLDCRYCFYRGTDDILGGGRHPVMPDEVLERMIADYLSYGFSPGVFTWQGGEPTLAGFNFFRRATELQAHYGSNGQLVGNALQTNGMLIDDEWAGFLDEFRFLVGLSLDGPPDIHDRYRLSIGGGASHERVMKAARTLENNGVEFNILCMITSLSQTKGREIYRYLVGEGFNYLQFIPCVEYDPGTGDPSPYNVSPEGWGRFMSDVFDVWYERDVGLVSVRTFESMAGVLAGLPEPGICTIGTVCDNYLVVEKEGDVYPCDFFVDPAYYLGNLMETPLIEIYRSERERAFSLMKSDYAQGCRTCRWLGLCHGGCPKDRLCGGRGTMAGVTPLCEGIKLFLGHTGDRLREISAVLRAQIHAASHEAASASAPLPGRNDPCPCGSGKKYKRCCMK